MTEEFTVRIEADESVDTQKYLWDVLEQLDGIEGVHSVMVKSEEDRDISEVVRILNGLSEYEMSTLEETINSYTREEPR